LPGSSPSRADFAASEVNWLIGGRWVRDGVPCVAHTSRGTDLPQGAEFSSNSARVWLPAELAIETPQSFAAEYQAEGTKLTVRLTRSDRQSQVVWFRELSDGVASDDQGLVFRRCDTGPVS
jgi:hypothetical protein